MRKLLFPLCLALTLLASSFSLLHVARGQGTSGPDVLREEIQGENRREIRGTAPEGAAGPASIGFIDSPSATCYQPDPARDECYLSWYYMSVSASPDYMHTLSVTVNAIGTVVHTQGFFQTSMYIPYDMLGKGFKVACGAPGSGSQPTLGMSYAYTIRARDSNNLAAANYGTTHCPAFQP